MSGTCSRPRCDGAKHRRGLCGRHWQASTSFGEFGYTPAFPVAKHIEDLLALGWSWQGIASRAGVSFTAVRRAKTRKSMWRPVARAILSVELGPYINFYNGISPVGAERRTQALQWMGWTIKAIGARAGVRSTSLINCFRKRSISTELDRRITMVYEELSGTRGPSELSANRALKRGWAPPAAWEDIDMDDPDALPNRSGYDEQTVLLLLAGVNVPHQRVDLAEMARRCPQGKLTSTAKKLGIPVGTIAYIAKSVEKRCA